MVMLCRLPLSPRPSPPSAARSLLLSCCRSPPSPSTPRTGLSIARLFPAGSNGTVIANIDGAGNPEAIITGSAVGGFSILTKLTGHAGTAYVEIGFAYHRDARDRRAAGSSGAIQSVSDGNGQIMWLARWSTTIMTPCWCPGAASRWWKCIASRCPTTSGYTRWQASMAMANFASPGLHLWLFLQRGASCCDPSGHRHR